MNFGYLLCYQVSGSHAFGYHLANILLHAVVVCALFLLTQRMFQNRDMAFMAAALFAIHPIHSEAVAWIVASSDLEMRFFTCSLSGFF
jgi:4-amino-4-deoxy-L-arabinose transferase-like glycosyltransferase